MTARSSNAAPILAALAMVIVPLGAYVGAYFSLAKLSSWKDPKTGEVTLLRYYMQPWQTKFFWPAGRAEEALRRTNVMVELWVEP